MGNKMSNPYIEANIEFAERLVESLAPRVTNGTGSQLTLTAGEVGALKAILEGFLDNQDLEHDKDFAEKTGLEWSRLACEYRARVEGLENGLFALVPKTPTENMMLNGLIVVSLGIGKTDIWKEIAMTWEKMIEGAKP